jgi:predicted DNA binding protein
MMDEGRYDLTKTQRDTLLAAYQSGYFEDPQGITQAELAERFGVSQRAVSKRLRSGVSRLIGNTLASEA